MNTIVANLEETNENARFFVYVCVYVTVGKKSHTSVTLAQEKVSRKECYALHTHTRTHAHARTQRKNTQSHFNNYFTKILSFTIWVVS